MKKAVIVGLVLVLVYRAWSAVPNKGRETMKKKPGSATGPEKITDLEESEKITGAGGAEKPKGTEGPEVGQNGPPPGSTRYPGPFNPLRVDFGPPFGVWYVQVGKR